MRLRGAEGILIRVLCEAPRTHALVKNNLDKLIAAGADVRTYNPDLYLRTRGILVDSERDGECTGIVISRVPKSSVTVQEGKPGASNLYDYNGSWLRSDGAAPEVDLMHRLFEAHYALGRDALILTPAAIGTPSLLKALQVVSQYSDLDESRIALRHLDLDELYSSCTVVNGSKLEAISGLLTQFENQRLPVFDSVICSSRRFSGVLLPPIVECNDERYVIIDGIHRLFERMVVRGKRTAQCLVLTVDKSLPGDPIRLRDVRIVPEKISRDRAFLHYAPSAFRRIKDVYQALRLDAAAP